jgi:hypothetical protein
VGKEKLKKKIFMNRILTILLFVLALNANAQKDQQTQGENFANSKIPVPGIPQKLQAIAGAKKMNVIFILTDDHRPDFMGLYRKSKMAKNSCYG